MDHGQFMPFHNYYIEFILFNGMTCKGVVIDNWDDEQKKYGTQYAFVSTGRMRAWKNAETGKDEETMKLLQRPINILNIVGARHLTGTCKSDNFYTYIN